MSLNKVWNTDIWASVWNWDIWADSDTNKMAILASITFAPTLDSTITTGSNVSASDPTVAATVNATIDIEPEE